MKIDKFKFLALSNFFSINFRTLIQRKLEFSRLLKLLNLHGNKQKFIKKMNNLNYFLKVYLSNNFSKIVLFYFLNQKIYICFKTFSS